MNVEQAVLNAVEQEAKTVAAAVATEAKEAVVEVKGVAAQAGEVVKATIVQITTEEKLVARELELEYLKVTMEIQRLTKITEEKARAYQANVEGWLKKYGLTKDEFIFDATINAFKKL